MRGCIVQKVSKLLFVALLAIGVTLLLVPVSSSEPNLAVSLRLDDNVVNPGQKIVLTGHAVLEGGALGNNSVDLYVDGNRQEMVWSQLSQGD